MKKSTLFLIWGFLYIICAMVGFIPEPDGAVKFLLNVLSVLFFVPPALLLRQARQKKDNPLRKTILSVSIASLVLTVAAFIGCIRTAMASETVGNLMHGVLNMVSVPMLISPWWALSLFLWSCLMIASLAKNRR